MSHTCNATIDLMLAGPARRVCLVQSSRSNAMVKPRCSSWQSAPLWCAICAQMLLIRVVSEMGLANLQRDAGVSFPAISLSFPHYGVCCFKATQSCLANTYAQTHGRHLPRSSTKPHFWILNIQQNNTYKDMILLPERRLHISLPAFVWFLPLFAFPYICLGFPFPHPLHSWSLARQALSLQALLGMMPTRLTTYGEMPSNLFLLTQRGGEKQSSYHLNHLPWLQNDMLQPGRVPRNPRNETNCLQSSARKNLSCCCTSRSLFLKGRRAALPPCCKHYRIDSLGNFSGNWLPEDLVIMSKLFLQENFPAIPALHNATPGLPFFLSAEANSLGNSPAIVLLLFLAIPWRLMPKWNYPAGNVCEKGGTSRRLSGRFLMQCAALQNTLQVWGWHLWRLAHGVCSYCKRPPAFFTPNVVWAYI